MISCNGKEPVKEPTNIRADTIWSSPKYGGCEIIVDGSFNSFAVKSDGEKSYYVWSKKNEFLYIIQLSTKDGFPLGKDTIEPGEMPQGLLKYVPEQYVIWKGINQRSYEILMNMGVAVPLYKVVLVKEICMNKARNNIVWVVYGKAWNDEHENFIKILDYYREVVK